VPDRARLRERGRPPGQAAELEEVLVELEELDEEPEEEAAEDVVREAEDPLDHDVADVYDFEVEAGVLLDEVPRLSLL
jgi:hypothetical protein